MRLSFILILLPFLAWAQSPGDVLINEVITDPQQDWSTNGFDGTIGGGAIDSDDDWVELYIVTTGLNLTSWTIELNDGTNVSGTIAAGGAFTISNYIPSGGGSFTSTMPGDYLVLGNITSGAINQSVTVVLKDNTSQVIDQVIIASGSGTMFTGNASTISDESVCRIPNGEDTDIETDDFVKTRATLGASNSPSGTVLINEVVVDPQQDWSTNGFDGTVAGGTISQGTDEWIELYIGTSGLNLTKWTLEISDGSLPTPDFFSGDLENGGAFQTTTYFGSGSFTNTVAGDYLVLGNPQGAESITNDAYIVLKDASGTVVDDVEIGDDIENDGAGDGAHDGTASGGDADGVFNESIARAPNGSDTDNDVNDFVQHNPTMGGSNGLSTTYVDASAIDDSGLGTIGDPKKVIGSAIDFTFEGGTVIVASGNYAESLTINRALTLQGANQGIAAAGSRVSETVLDPSSNDVAITILSSSVTVDGFQIGSSASASNATTAIVNDGNTAITITNNIIYANTAGVDLRNVNTGSINVSNNNIDMLNLEDQTNATNPSYGMILLALNGSVDADFTDNSISDASFGIYGFDLSSSAGDLTISGGTYTGCMKGIEVDNTDGSTFAPSEVHISDVTMSGFSGPDTDVFAVPGDQAQAGIYSFISSATGVTTDDDVTLTVDNVDVSGVGNLQSDYAAIYMAGFATDGSGVDLTLNLSNANIHANLNRGFHVRGATTVATISQSAITENGFDAYDDGSGGTTDPGFNLIARVGADVTISNCFFTNAASQTYGASYGVYSFDAVTSVVVSGSSFSSAGNGFIAVGSSGVLNMSGNYLGSTDPTSISSTLSSPSSIDFTPYLESSTDTDLGTEGFQGDFDNVIVTNLGGQTGATQRIQEAFDFIGTGDTVSLNLDDYSETLTANKSATIATLSNDVTLDNLVMNASGGVLGLTGDLTINTALTMTDGTISVAQGSRLILANTVPIPTESATSYVSGPLATERTVGTGALDLFGVNIAAGEDIGNVTITRSFGPSSVVTDGPYTSIAAVWDITVDTQPSTTGRAVSFTWDAQFDNGKDMTQISLFKNEGSGWSEFAGPEDVSASSPRTYPAVNTMSFSSWTLAQDDEPLPVTLLFFEAEYVDNQVELHWASATEINVDYYQLERRTGDQEFQPIARVEAAGDSDARLEYHYTDNDFIENNTIFYRLKNVDIDNAYEYLGVVQVTKDRRFENRVSIYPNPSSDFLSVSSSAPINKLIIYDMLGKKLVESNEVEKLDIQQLPKGCYSLMIELGDYLEQHAFVKK